jgi:multicomponent Na+:H+ antiporter subunit E
VRLLGRVALLVVLWLLAWGEFSLVNVLSGLAVGTAVLIGFPPAKRPSGRVLVHPVGTARLAAYVVTQLVTSNVVMARQILSRRPDIRQGVVDHRLRHPSEEVVTVMTSVIALSPGTMTVDVDPGSTTISVHFFRLTDPAAAHASLERLEQLVLDAIVPPGAASVSASEELP